MSITPDSTAETCDGAAAWAPGSQKCTGTTPALIPNPTSASSRITVPAAPAGRVVASAANVSSGAPRPQPANIASSAIVLAWVRTR